MKLKSSAWVAILSFATILGAVLVKPAESPKAPVTHGRVPYEYLLDEVNSLSRLLYELAAERHAANSNRGAIWILTVHEGRTFRRYTDKKYTVLSLPVAQATDKIAMCRYAGQYNVQNIQAADGMVKAGKYSDAREIYRLVLHFDRCGDDLLKERTEQKLALLDEMQKGQNIGTNLEKFADLCDELGLLVDFSQVDHLPATTVTNLLSLRLP